MFFSEDDCFIGCIDAMFDGMIGCLEVLQVMLRGIFVVGIVVDGS